MLHFSFSQSKSSKTKLLNTGTTTSSTSVVVTTRTIVTDRPKPVAKPPIPASSTRLHSKPQPKPRKEPPRPVAATKKRKRSTSPAPRAKKVQRSQEYDEEAEIIRPVRSRKGTPTTTIGGAFGSLECTIPRPVSIEEDGAVVCVSSEDVVKAALHEYKAYFNNPDDAKDVSFRPHSTEYPTAELAYPNSNASERFILLFPTDKDDYQPIRELINTIETIVENYLTVEQRLLFGHSSSLLPDSTLIRASNSPAPSSITSTGTSTPIQPTTNLLRILTKAYNTRNGPLFTRTVAAISTLFGDMRPLMLDNIKTSDAWTGVPPKVWKTIVEECYQRSVGPKVDDLSKYVPFSDNVYGELNASFVSDIVHRTGLGPGKNFVDLGCGVGNCLFQASLQSKGIELLAAPANLAHLQKTEYTARLRKWGLSSGDVHIRSGDFCEHDDVKSWMSTADVVLVNNWAFSAQLNERLSLLFLDLPEDAKVISLKPFVTSDFKLNQRTIGSPLAILRVEQCPFRRGAVSWTAEGGVYYLNTIDRRRVCEFVEGSARVDRPTRSRR